MKYKYLIFLLLWLFNSPLSGQDVSAVVQDESSAGAQDGSITLTMLGGFAPFEYKWSGPNNFMATTQNISGLAPGQYCVTITDAICGTLELCRIVSKCDPVVAVYTGANCPYNSNGYMGLIFSGVPPFKLKWSDGTMSSTNLFGSLRTGLPLGIYCVTVTDGRGCSEEVCRAVLSPVPPISLSPTIIQPACGTMGSITMAVTGGYSPYTFNWSDNVTTKDRTNLNPGTYCVTVTDKKGCTSTGCFGINPVTNNLVVNLASITPKSECKPETCNGAISVGATGGTTPYTYNWSGPGNFMGNTATISGLCRTGLYVVTVTDASGCTRNSIFILCCCDSGTGGSPNEFVCPSTVSININATVNSATNTSGGTINLTITGTSGQPYSLEWRKNGVFYSYSEDITNLSPGNYCVYVKSGCKQESRCFTIVNCDEYNITIQGTTETACQSYNVGAITLINVNGGTEPYTYKWSNGDQNKNLSNLTPGTYTVTATDKNYCKGIQDFTVGLGEITYQDVECTRLTFCGNQIVAQQQFPQELQFQADCGFARIVCANGFMGPVMRIMGTVGYTAGGPNACAINEFCANGQFRMTHIGSPTYIGSTGGVTGPMCNPTVTCIRLGSCTYPTLGGFTDPASALVIGAGIAGLGAWQTSCDHGNCGGACDSPSPIGDIREIVCDGVPIGTICLDNSCALTGGNDGLDALPPYNQQEVDQEMIKEALQKLGYKTKLISIGERKYDIVLDTSTLYPIYRNIKVNPNPFSSVFTVEIVSEEIMDTQIEISEITGKIIYTSPQVLQQGENTIRIDLPTSIPAGVYLLREIPRTGKVTTIKIVKS